jgi:hypothetical protein
MRGGAVGGVLAWVSDVVVAVWGWLGATFAWSDALVSVVGVASVTVGSIAIGQARKSRGVARGANTLSKKSTEIAEGAKAAADKANEIAERMEALAREANEFSKRALTTGEGAKEAAVEANGIARAANTLAQEANDLFKQQDERSTERHDVRWEGEFVEPGVYRLTNKGDHTAHKVVATVAYESDERQVEADEVPGRGFLDFELPAAKQEYLDRRAQIQELEAEKRRRVRDSAAVSHDRILGPIAHQDTAHENWMDDLHISRIQATMDSVSENVHWETERSAPRVHKESRSCAHLGAEL